MSAIEDMVISVAEKVEVLWVSRDDSGFSARTSAIQWDGYVGDKRVGYLTYFPAGVLTKWVATFFIQRIDLVWGYGMTPAEAIHDAFTEGFIRTEQLLNEAKTLSIDHGGQLALAASHLEESHVR